MWVCGGQRGTGIGFSPCVSAFPCHYHENASVDHDLECWIQGWYITYCWTTLRHVDVVSSNTCLQTVHFNLRRSCLIQTSWVNTKCLTKLQNKPTETFNILHMANGEDCRVTWNTITKWLQGCIDMLRALDNSYGAMYSVPWKLLWKG